MNPDFQKFRYAVETRTRHHEIIGQVIAVEGGVLTIFEFDADKDLLPLASFAPRFWLAVTRYPEE